MAGDIKAKYGSTSALTVTDLQSLAASSGRTAGWSSGTVDNTSTLALDYLLGCQFTTHASNRQAGAIDVWLYSQFDVAGTWPDLFSSGTEGSQGAATVHDTEERDSGMASFDSITCDNTASAVYTSVKKGVASRFDCYAPPEKWAIFVAHDITTGTNAGFHTSGSAIYVTPVLAQYT